MLSSSYKEVCTAYLLILTIPVFVASAGRSVSKLKIIKNYLRNSTRQQRLSDLAILVIENSTAQGIDTEKIIKAFANVKARKVDF